MNKIPGYNYRNKLGPIPPDNWDNNLDYEPIADKELFDKLDKIAEKKEEKFDKPPPGGEKVLFRRRTHAK